MIFHDLVHGNYFKNVFVNNTLGWLTGVILFTPFKFWKKDHLLHHATTGNLDRRGYGEIKTLTVAEFQTLSKYQKFNYQIYRNPVFLFVVAPLLLFLFRHRVAWRNWNNEKMSIHSTNLGIMFVAATIIFLWGWQAYVFGYLVSLYLGFCIVAWFFYVQHHFENTYYATANSWRYTQGALQGSSFYKLPKMINAFTINIGYHHIHHFNSRIPSYNLQEVFKRFPVFQNSPTLTIKTSIACIHANLWDTQKNKMVSFQSLSPVSEVH